MQKVIIYIDGFNLYFGLKEKGWKRYYWLNLVTLAKSLLKPGQTLQEVKYFTSRFSYELQKVANATFTIGRKKFAESLFPDHVTKTDGHVLKRPDRWKHGESI